MGEEGRLIFLENQFSTKVYAEDCSTRLYPKYKKSFYKPVARLIIG